MASQDGFEDKKKQRDEQVQRLKTIMEQANRETGEAFGELTQPQYLFSNDPIANARRVAEVRIAEARYRHQFAVEELRYIRDQEEAERRERLEEERRKNSEAEAARRDKQEEQRRANNEAQSHRMERISDASRWAAIFAAMAAIIQALTAVYAEYTKPFTTAFSSGSPRVPEEARQNTLVPPESSLSPEHVGTSRPRSR